MPTKIHKIYQLALGEAPDDTLSVVCTLANAVEETKHWVSEDPYNLQFLTNGDPEVVKTLTFELIDTSVVVTAPDGKNEVIYLYELTSHTGLGEE
ncbi:hypothetical protein VPHK449_0027 [Vibrio phage K449]